MKHRAIVSGIAALCVVGVVYSFAFNDNSSNDVENALMIDTVSIDTVELEQASISKELIDIPSEDEQIVLEDEVEKEVFYEAEAVVEDTVEDTVEESEEQEDILSPIMEMQGSVERNTEYVSIDEPVETSALIFETVDYDVEPIVTTVPIMDEEEIITQVVESITEPVKTTTVAETKAEVETETETEIVIEEESLVDMDEVQAEFARLLSEAVTATTTVTTYVDIAYADTSYETTTVTEVTTAYYDTTTVTTAVESGSLLGDDLTGYVDGVEFFTVKYGGETHEIDAYSLTCMIVQNEMSPYFSKEALKAQAVAAYSYVKYHNVNGVIPSVLVKTDIDDAIRGAVDEVFGLCCYYNGDVAQTVYTASTAGTSADAYNVWGGYAPYLVSVDTSFDVENDPNYGVTATFSESYVRRQLESYCGITLSDDPENWIVVLTHNDGLYVGNILVDGQVIITGKQLKESVLDYGIKSWAFDLEYEDGVFTFTTYGYGHGVGMSQNGAYYLAQQGWTFDEILKYYYTGVTIA